MLGKKKTDCVNNVAKLNLLDTSFLTTETFGISWVTFSISVALTVVLAIAPVLSLKMMNKRLEAEIDELNMLHKKLIKKEKMFQQLVKEKESIMSFIQTAMSMVENQPQIDIVLDEIRKRLPKDVEIEGGISLKIGPDNVQTSLKVISTRYLSAPQILDAFALSPYLYVKSAKVEPLNINAINKNEKLWSYSVDLVLGWKVNQQKEGETK